MHINLCTHSHSYHSSFSTLQFVAVVMAIAGIVLFAYVEQGFGTAGVVGVVLSLGSAIGAALYKVI